MTMNRRGSGGTATSTRTTQQQPVQRVAPIDDIPAKATSHPAIFVTVLGVGFLALFTIGIMMQVQTNEALITNAGNVDVYQPDWAIFLQIPELLIGGLGSAQEAAAAIVGWGIELIYLGFIVGFEYLQHATSRSGRMMGKIFRIASFLILFFNMYTDYKYGNLGGGTWGHILFAAVASFIVGFFGTIGMYFLEIGWKKAEA